MACLFQNPSYPEYICPTSSGAMCLHFHPEHPHMLAVGLHDGNVCVFNLQKERKTPIYISNAANGKHKDIVWQVMAADKARCKTQSLTSEYPADETSSAGYLEEFFQISEFFVLVSVLFKINTYG